MKILIVKMSSLGDIIHTLPALSDLGSKINIKCDWLVEPAFQEIPSWHKFIRRVIPIPLRNARRDGILSKKSRTQLLAAIKLLRSEHYDIIIDGQGLLKSALATRFARGSKVVGYSFSSAREPIASLFYSQRFIVKKQQHAVERLRCLFAQAFGYEYSNSTPDYGIDKKIFQPINTDTFQPPYYVFLHGTTWETKHWPYMYWVKLAAKVCRDGSRVKILWGSEEEKERANALAMQVKGVDICPKMNLKEIVPLLSKAKGVVSLDTGLAHLAAALNVPNVTIYGPTSPMLAGTYGLNQHQYSANIACSPCLKRQCREEPLNNVSPPCLALATPEIIWQLMQAKFSL